MLPSISKITPDYSASWTFKWQELAEVVLVLNEWNELRKMRTETNSEGVEGRAAASGCRASHMFSQQPYQNFSIARLNVATMRGRTSEMVETLE